MKTKILFLVFVAAAFRMSGNSINVPSDFPTIQSAIESSTNGDSVIVQPGNYFENLNFRGKNIFLTSLYYLNNDTSYITSTVINGSTPSDPDTGSCVIFNSGEDSTAVIQGFTITGGTGTLWLDPHGAGIYREGGGILIELSSPSVLHNSILYNFASNVTGATSSGGGGLRIGDGNPLVMNNVIMFNQGIYGAGIVMNFTGGKILNNVIASNTGGQAYYGGSAIWILDNMGNTPKIIVNNTIVNNSASQVNGTGGISCWSANNVLIKNNIVYGNYPAVQIKATSSTPDVSYCNIQDGYAGVGNIDSDPLFESTSYFLGTGSACIDAGDSSLQYRDIQSTDVPGLVIFPCKGSLRNDMGAYGGPNSSLLPLFQSLTGINSPVASLNEVMVSPNPFSENLRIDYVLIKESFVSINLYSETGKCISTSIVNEKRSAGYHSEKINIRNSLPSGNYFVAISSGADNIVSRKIIKVL